MFQFKKGKNIMKNKYLKLIISTYYQVKMNNHFKLKLKEQIIFNRY